MPDPDVHSRVKEIEVRQENGKTQTKVIVQLVGFREYDYVQLSGYAAQKNGAFCAISGQYAIGSVDSDGLTLLQVPVTPNKDFVEDEEVTAALWAAQAWITVLEKDKDVTPPVIRAWKPQYSAPDYAADGS
jgi:hypothetical protein